MELQIMNSSKKVEMWNAGWSYNNDDNYTSVPLASPLSQISTYSMDSGYLEQSGSSPPQLSSSGATIHEFSSSNNAMISHITQAYSEFSDQNSPYNCMQDFYDTQVPITTMYPTYTSPAPATVPTNSFVQVNSDAHTKPCLRIVEQPTDKPFRFRYKSEMHGTHGSLMGIRTERSRRTYPTVELRNFNFATKATIRCSLYQVPSDATTKRSPHSHKLVIRRGDVEESDPHDIEVSSQNSFKATFQGMGIIHTAKRDIKQELFKKIRDEKSFEANRELTSPELTAIERDAEKLSKEMNLNQVCLCFQAFIKNEEANNCWVKICEPIYSNVVNNMKSALTGELRIVRMSTCTSPADGGQEIFMFVEKVCKNNIKVKFYEMRDNDEYWVDYGIFSESDVHHQYGIILKTPAYKTRSIDSPVTVKVQLYRQSDGATSEPIEFRYKPNVNKVGSKRARSDSSEFIPTVVGSHETYLHEASTTFGSTCQNQDSSQSFGSKCDANQNYDMDVSLFQTDPLPSYFASFTASDLNFSSNDLKGLWCPEEFCRLLDIEIDGESKLQLDAVSGDSSKIQEASSSQDIRYSLLDKLKVIIKLFKNNFEEEKLRDMLIVLVNAQAEMGENIFLDCIQNGTIDEIKNLIMILVKYKLSDVLKSKNDLDQNCFHLLIIAGYQSLLKIFLNMGVDVNQVDAFGETPLHVAVIKNSTESVDEILDWSTSIKLNELNDDGFSPLHLAVMKNNLELVRKLIEAGADVHKKSPLSGDNVLHLAVGASNANMDIIKYLITCDENLLYKQNNGRLNVLQVASDQNQPETLIQFLATFYEESYQKARVSDDEITSESDNDETVQEISETIIDERINLGSHNDRVQEILETTFDELCLQELCKIFDTDDEWQHVLTIMGYEEKIDEWKNLTSPSRRLFTYLEEIKKSIDDLVETFDILHAKRAILVIDEMLVRKLDK